MNKWISKGGLTAVFKDAVMMPVNFFRLYKQTHTALAIAHLAAPTIVGVGMAQTFPVAAGIPAFIGILYLFNGFSALLHLGDNSDRKFIWPNVTKFSNSLKPQNG